MNLSDYSNFEILREKEHTAISTAEGHARIAIGHLGLANLALFNCHPDVDPTETSYQVSVIMSELVKLLDIIESDRKLSNARPKQHNS